MASGKKNYFRHSYFARKHPAIAGLIQDLGKEAYFHFFALVEVCAEQASDKFPEDSRFTFRRSTLCHELLVTNSRLGRHLLAMVPSLVDDIVVTEKEVQLLFPKLAKHMGKYDTKSDSNSPNKEKKRKEKESKEPMLVTEDFKPEFFSEVIEEPKKNLPKPKSKGKRNLEKSPLSILFPKPEDPIHEWLLTGTSDVQNELLETYSHHQLAGEIRSAFQWHLEKKPRKAGLYLKTWMQNSRKSLYGIESEEDQLHAARELFKSKFGVYPESNQEQA